MKKTSKKSIDYREHEDSSRIQACSATDCTGLIPSLPESEDQLEAYEDLYPFLTPALQNKTDCSSSH